MKKSDKTIEHIWPDYFDRFTLPEGAHEEEILVYRACRTNKCEKASFLPTFEENGYIVFDEKEEIDPGTYSLSVYEKAKDVKRFTVLRADYPKPCKIAIGYTRSKHGLVQRTRERTHRKSSHIDWWLYKDARPYEEFEIIENLESHLERGQK